MAEKGKEDKIVIQIIIQEKVGDGRESSVNNNRRKKKKKEKLRKKREKEQKEGKEKQRKNRECRVKSKANYNLILNIQIKIQNAMTYKIKVSKNKNFKREIFMRNFAWKKIKNSSKEIQLYIYMYEHILIELHRLM